METPRHKVLLGLGSNIGDRAANLRSARDELSSYMDISAISPVYETEPAYVTDQLAFFNAAVAGETALDPKALLFTIKEIERRIGRTPTYRFGPRVIDIDILFFDDIVLSTPELSIPHPAIAERSFVLNPLNDIAPDWRHPTTGSSVSSMLEALNDFSGFRQINEVL